MAAERGRSGGKLGEQEVAVAVGAAKAQAEWALGFCFADMSGLEVGLEEESEVRTKESPDKLRYWWTAVTAAKRVVMGMSSNTTVEQAISTAVAVAVKKATEQLERYEQSIREQQERGWVPLQRCTMNPTLETGLGSSEHKRGPVQENGQGNAGLPWRKGADGAGQESHRSYCAVAKKAPPNRVDGGRGWRQHVNTSNEPMPGSGEHPAAGGGYFSRREVVQRLQYAVVFGGVRRPWNFHYKWIKASLKETTGIKVLSLFWRRDGLLEVRLKTEEDLTKLWALDGRTVNMTRMGSITLEVKPELSASQPEEDAQGFKKSPKVLKKKGLPNSSAAKKERASKTNKQRNQGATSQEAQWKEADLELTAEDTSKDVELNSARDEEQPEQQETSNEDEGTPARRGASAMVSFEGGSPIEQKSMCQDRSSDGSMPVDFDESTIVADSPDLHESEAALSGTGQATGDALRVAHERVSKTSLATLEGRAWINDEVIAAYFALLNGEAGVVAFGPTLLTKLQGKDQEQGWERKWWSRRTCSTIEQTRIVIAPVNVNENHWILIAADTGTRVIKSFCSLGKSGYGKFNGLMANFLRAQCSDVDQRGWTTSSQSLGLARQPDGNECGVFMCMTAMKLAKGLHSDSYTADQVYTKRAGRRLIEMSLRNGTLEDIGAIAPGDSSAAKVPHGDSVPVQDRC